MSNTFTLYYTLIRRAAFIFKRQRYNTKKGVNYPIPSIEEVVNKYFEGYDKSKSIEDKESLRRNLLDAYANLIKEKNLQILNGTEYIKCSSSKETGLKKPEESDDYFDSDLGDESESECVDYEKQIFLNDDVIRIYDSAVDLILGENFEKCLQSYNKEKNNSFLMYTLGFVRNIMRSSIRKNENRKKNETSFDKIKDDQWTIEDQSDDDESIETNSKYQTDSYLQTNTDDEDILSGDKSQLDIVKDALKGPDITNATRRYSAVQILHKYLDLSYEGFSKMYQKQNKTSSTDFSALANEYLREDFRTFMYDMDILSDEIKQTLSEVYEYISKYISDKKAFPTIGKIAQDVLNLKSSSLLSHSYNQLMKKIREN